MKQWWEKFLKFLTTSLEVTIMLQNFSKFLYFATSKNSCRAEHLFGLFSDSSSLFCHFFSLFFLSLIYLGCCFYRCAKYWENRRISFWVWMLLLHHKGTVPVDTQISIGCKIWKQKLQQYALRKSLIFNFEWPGMLASLFRWL